MKSPPAPGPPPRLAIAGLVLVALAVAVTSSPRRRSGAPREDPAAAPGPAQGDVTVYGDASQLRISELLANNRRTVADPQGEFDDWIELHCPGPAPVRLDGLCLSDDPREPDRWRFPPGSVIGAGEYLLVWADEDAPGDGADLHASFELDADGDEIGLYQADGRTVIDRVRFGRQRRDVSFGRSAAGSTAWRHFTAPTPGSANEQTPTGEVFFSRPGGVITDPFRLELSTASGHDAIRYTLDGSDPGAASPLYDGAVGVPIGCASSTRLRARAFGSGGAPGPVRSAVYLPLDEAARGFSTNLPIVVIDTLGRPIVADRASRPWVDGFAAFIPPGPDGRARLTGRAQHTGFVALRHRGASTYGQGGYRLELRDELGEEASAPLLGLPEESDWVLHRLAYDDSAMRDVLAFQWSNEAGLYAPRTQYFVLFLAAQEGGAPKNLGLYVLTESIKVGKNRVDLSRLGPSDTTTPEVTGGYLFHLEGPEAARPDEPRIGNFTIDHPRRITKEQETWLAGWLATSESRPYRECLDVEAFLICQAVVEVCSPIDWYGSSTYFNKDRGGKLRPGPLWDFNLSLGNPIGSASRFDRWNGLGTPYMSRILADPEGRLQWRDLWFRLRESVFAREKVVADVKRWSDYISEARAADVADLEHFLARRLDWIDRNIGVAPPEIRCDGQAPGDLGPASGGREVTIQGRSGATYFTTDGSDPREASTGAAVGTPYSRPFTITHSARIRARSLDAGEWSALGEATVIVGSVADLRISEALLRPRPPALGFVELVNVGRAPLNLALCELTGRAAFKLPDRWLAPGELALVVADQEAFVELHPDAAHLVLGEYSSGPPGGDEELVLVGPAGALQAVRREHGGPLAAGAGFSLCWAEAAGGWRPGRRRGGTPGAPDAEPTAAADAVVIHEVMAESTRPDEGDWIELHNTTDAPLDLSGWFLSDDRARLVKYELAAGTILPARGFVVLTAEGHFRNRRDPGCHVEFDLAELGGTVVLSSGARGALAGGICVEAAFGTSFEGRTWGRVPTGGGPGELVVLTRATKGAANAPPWLPVVISELQPGGGDEPDELVEFIELHNRSRTHIALFDRSHRANTWRFTQGVSYTFPPQVTLAADEYVLVVRTAPALFRARHGVPASVRIFGPFSGDLSDRGETLELSQPTTPRADGTVPFARVDRVVYGAPTAGEQPTALHRGPEAPLADDPARWRGQRTTPGGE